jgi:hypothetical protein
MRKVAVGLICSAAALTLVAQGAGAAPGGPRFAAPVLLTTDKYTGGYEPSIAVDRFNNIVVTAHKQNHSLVLSPDERSATKLRSQSWLWTSKDGKTFTDMPGLTPLQEQNLEFGDEGDVAYDETGHIYFVDTNVADNSFSRYKATGNGQLALETTRPIGPFGEPVDDRPWIAAHGDGVVMYAGNQGDKQSYPAGRTGDGDAYGPGRYTVYMSYDHGDTFDPLGVTLNDSGWCRPGADHARGSKLLYVVCSNDGDADGKSGTFWSYVSRDDGKTWSRYRMGGYDKKKTVSWPSITIGADGTVYVLYTEGKTSGRLQLLTSKNHGQSWTKRDVTPAEGVYQYESFDIAPNGTLGLAYYYRPGAGQPWHVYAATAKPGQRFVPTRVSTQPIASSKSTSPFGDFFEIAFGPDNKLNVVWTALNEDLLLEGLNSDIYFARQQ